ncbi:MAG: hypothetical protein NWF01_05740 [Candidatus Bathyarchaeota archaeon]|nr:hypothetical protein [Candidatus Bathyarchaeota archaeon]
METITNNCHVFSEGTTTVNKTIELESNGILQGVDSRSSIIHSTANPIIRVRNNAHCEFGKNALLENIVLEGDNSTTSQIAIELNDVSRCNINNVSIKDVDVGMRIRANTGNSSESNAIEHVQMENVTKGIQFYSNGSGTFNSTHIDGVSIALADQENLVGIEVGTDCTLTTPHIFASVISTQNCTGMYIDGTVNGEFIQFSHTKNSAAIGGVGISLGVNASVSDEYGHFFVSGRKLGAVLDNPYSKTNYIVESMDALPEGWVCSKSLDVFAGSGAGTDYQVILKAYYGSGTDGTETLNEETIAKFYCNSNCRTDFGDIRFLPSNSTTPYTYKLCSKVDGEWAVFAVKISEDLDVNQTIRAAYNNPAAVDVSSDDVFINKIDNVVGAWPLDEEDQEVDPLNIDLSQFTAVTNGSNNSSYGIDYDTETRVFTIDNSNNDSSVCIWKRYSPTPLDLSYGSVIRAKVIGTGSNQTYGILFTSHNESTAWYLADTDSVRYNLVDDFVGEKTIVFDKSNPTVAYGSINWSTVYRVRISCSPTATASITFLSLKLDEGVPAIDYSGNGNTGTATGTSITDSKWINRNARQAYDTNKIMLSSSITAFGTNAFSMWGYVYITAYPASGGYLTLIGGSNAYAPALAIFSTSGNLVLNQMAISTTGSGLSVPLNQWVFIGVTCTGYDGTATFYVNKTSVSTPMSGSTTPFSSGNNGLGTYLANADRYFIGKEAGIGIANGVLSAVQMNALADYYSDASLIESFICVRKWATTSLPTFGEWSV